MRDLSLQVPSNNHPWASVPGLKLANQRLTSLIVLVLTCNRLGTRFVESRRGHVGDTRSSGVTDSKSPTLTEHFDLLHL
jgi:hypothetical protein